MKLPGFQKIFIVLGALFITLGGWGQVTWIEGSVKSSDGSELPGATVIPVGQERSGMVTDLRGKYRIQLKGDVPCTIRFGFVGFRTEERTVTPLAGDTLYLPIILTAGVALAASEVFADGDRTSPVQRIDPKVASRIPSPRGTIEDLLIQAPVNFNSELSSAYNVRGGSFDENLVYVNDIEVYRPFLVRAGQQEGLSFPNPDMVEAISFSAGGFEAKFGDKLSSVLNIQYRKPKENRIRLTASMLGAQVQQDAVSKAGPLGHKRFTLNSGIRYRDNSYVLGSLDEGGEYQPRYIDLQTFATFDPDGYGPWQLEFLGMYGQNDYQFIPSTRQTDVGTINEALRLTIYFDGQEVTSFQTGFGAFAVNRITENTKWRWITSAFSTSESESFDILGAYYLDELERDLGSDELGEAMNNKGVGAFLNHARNQLNATVISTALKGSTFHTPSQSFWEWGAKWQREHITDALSEWSLVDSAGYISPHPRDSLGYTGTGPQQVIALNDIIRAENEVNSSRIQGYVQSTWNWETARGDLWKMNIGARAHHWSFSNQLVGGPRGHLSFAPASKSSDQSIVWNLSVGNYWQQPFYREMRQLDGSVNPNIRAQRARHAVFGMNRIFKLYGRPFKMVSELYFKDLDFLIPYEIENVRQRYYAKNNSSGYAAGIDFMLNGEFIDGVQSWLRLSVLKTAEDLEDDSYWQFYNDEGNAIITGFTLNNIPTDSSLIEPGWIPRQTDQRFNMSLLFQDEMPGNEAYKVLVSLYFGTGLPFGPPSFERYKDVLRTPTYRRVDIGFSRELFYNSEKSEGAKNRNGFISIEVFNILGIRNTINHTWIEDVSGRQYAISNYLTNRRVNLKISLSF
jgi:hypothetical protein